MNLQQVLLVASGGALGSVARFLTTKQVDLKFNSMVPLGTLTVNVVGSFILGFAYMVLARKTGMAEGWRLFLGTGFCGGFTTFSAFAFENWTLVTHKALPVSLFYMALSLALGILAVVAGSWCARFL